MLSLISIILGTAVALVIAYSLGIVLLRTLDVPWTITLAVGAALESLAVFLLLEAGAANRLAFLLLGAAALAMLVAAKRPVYKFRPLAADRVTCGLAAALLASYGVLYLVHALAPEIQPDGVTYHLGLVRQYLRLGSFSGEIAFFEMVPQGLEMLFLVAYAFGGGSAAKLVHFAFLVATVPLIVQIGRKLALGDRASLAAALVYFCAPVVGVTGTSSYNDAALVFFVLATFYILLAWRTKREVRFLLAAGITAGFCYAIKFPGILVLPLAAAFIWSVTRNRRDLWPLAGALVGIGPWMLRNFLLTGNPVAPLFNGLFSNPYFHMAMEQELKQKLSSYGGVTFLDAPYQLAFGGRLQGVFGAAFLLLPLGLASLRWPAGRICWLAGGMLSLPWFLNIGARFLMPSLPFLLLALAMTLPRPAAWAWLTLAGITCWPSMAARFSQGYAWQLRGFPWRAALRLESESEYLWRTTDEYKIARLIESSAEPGGRIFCLIPAPRAYLDHDTLDFWHSAKADQLLDAIRVGSFFLWDPLYNITADWPPAVAFGIRMRLLGDQGGAWCLHELKVFCRGEPVFSSPRWRLRAEPADWETPLAFDNSLATRWIRFDPMRTGMFVEAIFDRPQLLSSATAIVWRRTRPQVPIAFDLLGPDGNWRTRPGPIRVELRKPEDLRRSAAQAVRRGGFAYILADVGNEGNGPIGRSMVEHPDEWGIERAGQAGRVYLFRIRADRFPR